MLCFSFYVDVFYLGCITNDFIFDIAYTDGNVLLLVY